MFKTCSKQFFKTNVQNMSKTNVGTSSPIDPEKYVLSIFQTRIIRNSLLKMAIHLKFEQTTDATRQNPGRHRNKKSKQVSKNNKH